MNIPASFPEVTAIGGTTFSEGSGTYWNSTNSGYLASALGYIPEVAWNDTALRGSLSSTGGGVSQYYTKPSWQAGAGVPNDGRRDVPDISFSASADHDGYLIYYNGGLAVVGGTSAPAPAFAGAVALLNQYLLQNGGLQTPGLGNLNPSLYHLAQTSPAIFHDIVSGNNIVPCTVGTTNCTTGSLGYSAGVGYDLVTGLGSVDLNRLITGWNGVVASVSTTTTVTASPTSLLQSGSTQVTATVTPASGTTSPSGSVTFSIGSTTLNTVTLTSSGTNATASVSVSGSSLSLGTNTITATYSGNSLFTGSSGTTTVTVNSTPPSATATFLKSDTTTKGNWKSAYGGEGFTIDDDQTSNPSYASPISNGNPFVWLSSTTDLRALQKASNSSDRIASAWYSSSSFIIDTNISDQGQHQIAVYCVDWDNIDRRQTVEVLDNNGNVLDTQTLSQSFNGGVYLVWTVTGHVKIRFTRTGGSNAVVSGLFFGVANGVTTSATATFVKADTTTKGNWISTYGADGYAIEDQPASNPTYASPVSTGTPFIFSSSTTDVRGLQKPSNSADRIASAWYLSGSFVIDTNITDSAQHQVALYCVDWDTVDRRQTIDVLDSNGNVLNTQALTSSFNGGVYLVWNVTGHVKFRVTWTGGYNALVSGIFFR